jgi:hypothetical protein
MVKILSPILACDESPSLICVADKGGDCSSLRTAISLLTSLATTLASTLSPLVNLASIEPAPFTTCQLVMM